MARETQVQQIFSEIAPRYDLLNHVLSFNIDRGWRRAAIAKLGWPNCPDGAYLDACAGTCDLALELCGQEGFGGEVVASDFALPMLMAGKGKLGERPVRPVCGDSLRLPFRDASFDGITVGFGVRNLSDLSSGFRDFARVLRPGGRLVILDFTVPPNSLVKMGYMVYFNHILPLVGRLVSGHPWAYRYLPESVKEFPGPAELADLLRASGFTNVDWNLLTLGIAALHVAERR